jgi:hypothetical protein
MDAAAAACELERRGQKRRGEKRSRGFGSFLDSIASNLVSGVTWFC